jgi:hypothetical protein
MWQIIFVLSCIPIFIGTAIMLAVAGKPKQLTEKLQGAGRLLVLLGSAFGPVRVFQGSTVPWSAACLALGIAILVAIYARENHLLALAKERLTDVGQESGV